MAVASLPPVNRAWHAVALLVLLTGAACDRGSSRAAPPPTVPAVVASTGCVTSSATPGTTHLSLVSGRSTRTARQFVPKGYDGHTPTPLVIDLHGYLSNGDGQAAFSGIEPFADRAGFVVISPDGTGNPRHWNITVDARGPDDIGFLRALIDDAAGRLCIDRRRVFMAGMSNGAGMTSAAACHLGDIVAAFAAVAGVHGPITCGQGARPVALLAIHGTADPFLKYTGGFGASSVNLPRPTGVDLAIAANYPSPDRRSAMQQWAALDGCALVPVTTNQGSEVQVTRYEQCRPGTDVVLYTIVGGGHAWPGSAVSASVPQFVGRTTMALDANQVIWDFFSAHPSTSIR
ncbi:MAG: poly(3-hydroxybutyrate) depolymerase [Acidimicrobiales bacterium]|nr:poly(3-hydroxybutyrate) depolymerase [Acidimicrobiales bacterium]